MTVITRFPPSPTGFMHIGNARTALFNWLYARHTGGKFVVRIEDTDRKRHSEEAVQVIFDALKWLELDFDNEPVSQFENRQRHIDVAHELLAAGKAYKCYCTPEELTAMREAGHGYDRRWRDRSESEAPAGIEPAIRIKSPIDGQTTIHDKVQGDVTIKHDQLDDFIILRSDNTPTYMLSVVVDDHDMGVTHIIRGDDHLNNAFRQKVIFDAMNWNVPEFAHLPLIHGQDGAKFSKRHGAQGVEDYRALGYLPEAMRNYLLRLGWGHGDDELINDTQAVEWFDLGGIGKAAAKFDAAKLESFNAHYIQNKENNALLEAALPFFKIAPDDVAKRRIITHMDELKSRAKTLIQLADEALFYCKAVPFDFDEKAAEHITAENTDIFAGFIEAFAAAQDFDEAFVQAACKQIAADYREGKMGKVAMPLRAALTGTTISPSVFKAAEVLGKEETLSRIHNALKVIKNQA